VRIALVQSQITQLSLVASSTLSVTNRFSHASPIVTTPTLGGIQGSSRCLAILTGAVPTLIRSARFSRSQRKRPLVVCDDANHSLYSTECFHYSTKERGLTTSSSRVNKLMNKIHQHASAAIRIRTTPIGTTAVGGSSRIRP
jgi:hypothetical protein